MKTKFLLLMFTFALLLSLTAIGDELIKLDSEPVTYLQQYYDGWDSYCDLLDADMNVIEKRIYNVFSGFDENGIATVRQHGMKGYLKKDGSWLWEPQFDYAYGFTDDGYARVRLDGLYGYIKTDGTWLAEPAFYDAKDYNFGLAAVKTDLPHKAWGYLGTDGSFAISPAFDIAYSFSAFGTAIVATTTINPSSPFDSNRKFGILDTHGNWLFEPQFDIIYDFTEDGVARVGVNGLYGFIKADGTWLAEPIFYEVKDFSSGLALVKTDSFYGAWGYLDTDGNTVISPRFAYAERFSSDNTAVVAIDYQNSTNTWDQYRKYGVIDTEGNTVIDLIYDDIDRIWLHDNVYLPFYIIEKDYLYGLMDLSGNLLLEPIYDDITANDDGTIFEMSLGDDVEYYSIIHDTIEPLIIVTSSMNKRDYYPNFGSKVAVSDVPCTISWDESYGLPTLDGATGSLPVYSAWAQAVYPEWISYEDVKSDYISWQKVLFTCSKTAKAYERLINRECDIAFCLEASEEELKMADDKGVELEFTPIGYESFVFIVNSDNPIDGMTSQELRSIYSGETTNWAAFGHPEFGEIQAYQREPNSGSQTTFISFMGDTPIMEAPTEYYSDGMSDIVNTIEYRNYPNAIGYSFRFFLNGMMGSKLKMLSVDGIAPTVESISNGTYPYISTLYAITVKGNDNPNVQIFLDWATSEQGQALVQKSGYVPLSVLG